MNLVRLYHNEQNPILKLLSVKLSKCIFSFNLYLLIAYDMFCLISDKQGAPEKMSVPLDEQH